MIKTMSSPLEKSERPWGRYEVLSDQPTYKVKTIWVSPGQRLSYQRHEKRAEHPGDEVTFGIGIAHRMHNTGTEELILVEVQTGSYFGEDDITRIEDDFGR